MIVFPMAGLSRRFSAAGYSVPKYMLPLGDRTAFDYSVSGFIRPYEGETFVFVMRDVQNTAGFVRQRLEALGVGRYRLVLLDRMTSGQGETVELALDELDADENEQLTIFNIDTFRKNLTRPAPAAFGDGVLEVFRGPGEGWSFVDPAPGPDCRVARTTEKERISDLCCTGLYAFRTTSDFRAALAAERDRPSSPLPESYIAPIYNQLIGLGRDIRYRVISSDDVRFCGVPGEYVALLQDPKLLDGF